MTDDTTPAGTAAPVPASLGDLRRAFDRSFAAPPRRDAEGVDEFIAIRLGTAPYALAIPDVARLEPARKVVPLPADRPGLLGVAGVHGRLVPVFGLALLLGLPDRREDHPWLVLVDRDDPIGFAFDGVDGHLKVPRQATEAAGAAGHRPHVRHILQRGGEPPRPVIDIPGLAAALRAPAHTRTA